MDFYWFSVECRFVQLFIRKSFDNFVVQRLIRSLICTGSIVLAREPNIFCIIM